MIFFFQKCNLLLIFVSSTENSCSINGLTKIVFKINTILQYVREGKGTFHLRELISLA